ncbi:hypothetical protein ACFL38_02500 [Candidatus Omnitrophota bacterium]
MPYDPSKDASLFSKAWETEEGRLTVGVHQYNQGMKKLQISRENKDPEGEFRFAKMGRLTKEEAAAIIPLMQEALSFMD